MPSSPRAETTSVAPKARPRSVRAWWRPMRMICSAPRRLADSTASRPTAPSPMTVTRVRSSTPPATAAWWPVPKTSESVSRDGIRAESAATGSLTRVPSASGTRMASAWPPPRGQVVPEARLGFSQEVCRPSRQNVQVLSEMAKGATTRSPRLRVVTSEPVSSTMPMNSCPIRAGPSAGRHRAVGVQVAAADAGRGDAHQRVGGQLDDRVWDVLDADVAGAVHEGRAHDMLLSA